VIRNLSAEWRAHETDQDEWDGKSNFQETRVHSAAEGTTIAVGSWGGGGDSVAGGRFHSSGESVTRHIDRAKIKKKQGKKAREREGNKGIAQWERRLGKENELGGKDRARLPAI